MTLFAPLLLALITSGSAAIANRDPCAEHLDTWLACNNPRAINYLSRLARREKDEALRGVRLSDGRLAFKGYRLLGRAHDLPKGTHVYFVSRSGTRGAIAWVEERGTELPLPECPDSVPSSAYVLSGDVYTWKALQPGHGVVEVMCAPRDWPKSVTRQGIGPNGQESGRNALESARSN